MKKNRRAAAEWMEEQRQNLQQTHEVKQLVLQLYCAAKDLRGYDANWGFNPEVGKKIAQARELMIEAQALLPTFDQLQSIIDAHKS